MTALAVLLPLRDKTPAANDVVAGWVGFAVFIGLCLAVALLGYALSKQLKRTRENAERGVFDDEPSSRASTRS